jgi:hypothetical protein
MAKLPVDKINDLVGHVKANASKLASEGVDEKELTKHIAGLEAELKKPQPDHGALYDLLASLETKVEEAEEALALTGVLRFLNTIFGTGVPEPPERRG